MIKLFKSNSKSGLDIWQIENSRAVNIGNFQGSEISISATVTGSPFGGREAMLVVRVKNEGLKQIKAIKVNASTTSGASFVYPGEMFGTALAQELIQTLAPNQSITFKITLRCVDGPINESVSVSVSNSGMREKIEVSLPLISKLVPNRS